MNFQLRYNLPFNRLFFATITKTETCGGFDSNVNDEDKHFIFLDFDDAKEEMVRDELTILQTLYDLGEIIMTSDKPDSFHAFCFKQVSLRDLLKIMLDCEFVDFEQVRWTARNRKATLRMTPKEGRKAPRIIYIMPGKKHPIPENFRFVIYETPKGKTVKLGKKEN